MALASEVIGGPIGRFASIGTGWTQVCAVLVALGSAVVGLGVVQKQYCLRMGWSGSGQFWHACYSDLPVVYSSSGMAAGSMPYAGSGTPLDQPVLTGLLMWLVGKVAGVAVGHPAAHSPAAAYLILHQEQWYFALWAPLVMILLAVLTTLTAATSWTRPWRAAQVALSPVIVIAGLVSADLFGVVLTAAGVWAWYRRRLPLAGVLLGLAVMARSYPLLVIAAIGLVALRSGRTRDWGVVVGAALVTVVVVALPFLLTAPTQLTAVYQDWASSSAGYGSLWLIPGLFGGDVPAGFVTALAVLGMLGALLAGYLLSRMPGRPPGVAQLSLVMIAIVIVTGKSTPVQAALWLLPFVALAGIRWRDHLMWAGAEAAYFVGVWIYIAGTMPGAKHGGLPASAYTILVVVRIVMVLWLASRAWLLAPEEDPGEADAVPQAPPVPLEPASELAHEPTYELAYEHSGGGEQGG